VTAGWLNRLKKLNELNEERLFSVEIRVGVRQPRAEIAGEDEKWKGGGAGGMMEDRQALVCVCEVSYFGGASHG